MAVYKRTYKTYSGPRTAPWSRFLILTRYSYARLFQSKFLVLFLSACLFLSPRLPGFIYFSHNQQLLALLSLGNARLPAVDGKFFYTFCRVQGTLAYLLAALVGPGLISPDLANGAFPLYFSRPFSRTEYVAGKMTLSDFLAFPDHLGSRPRALLRSGRLGGLGLDQRQSLARRRRFFPACSSGSPFSRSSRLALSAWVKWNIAAGALVLAVFFAGAGFGAAINGVLRTHYGGLISLNQVIYTIWGGLFRYDCGAELSLGQAWTVLGLACAACACGCSSGASVLSRWSSERRPHPIRECFPLLRRSAWRQPRQPLDPSGHHQPGRSQRRRQNHADEPDDRPRPAQSRRHPCARHLPRRSGKAFPSGRLRQPIRLLPRRHDRIRIHPFVPPAFRLSAAECVSAPPKPIDRVRLGDAAHRKVAGYSKGMRQRIRLAQAIAHDPRVLVLDEPLNGLDPLVRAETIALFRQFAAEGRHVIVSSHILHEVDMISDQVDPPQQRLCRRGRPDSVACAAKSASSRCRS